VPAAQRQLSSVNSSSSAAAISVSSSTSAVQCQQFSTGSSSSEVSVNNTKYTRQLGAISVGISKKQEPQQSASQWQQYQQQ
jgi:hypothetical protein